MFEHGQPCSVVAGDFHFTQLDNWFEECRKEGFLHGAGAYDPGGDAVDAGVEIVEADVDAVEILAADEFLGGGVEIVGERDDVIAVPTDATADVQEDAIKPLEDGGNFVG